MSTNTHHYPSIDDWVCHKHNTRLTLFKGMARCPRVGCMNWLEHKEIERIRGIKSHYVVTPDGHLLRNIKRATTDEDDQLLKYTDAVDLDSPDVTKYWHVFAGMAPPSVAQELRPDVRVDSLSSVYLSTVIGPVLEPADGVFAKSGEPLKNGIALGVPSDPEEMRGVRLSLLRTWEHEPSERELRDVEAIEVARSYVEDDLGLNIVRSVIRWTDQVDPDEPNGAEAGVAPSVASSNGHVNITREDDDNG